MVLDPKRQIISRQIDGSELVIPPFESNSVSVRFSRAQPVEELTLVDFPSCARIEELEILALEAR